MIVIESASKKDTRQKIANARESAKSVCVSASMNSPHANAAGDMEFDHPIPADVSNKPATPAGIERYFQLVPRKRKREQINADDSTPSPAGQHPNIDKTEKPKTSSNRFALLQDESDITPKPPPIYVRVQNNTELINGIKSLVKKDLFYIVDIKRGLLKETKIQMQREVDYCQIINWLDTQKLEFYTYQLKSEKGLRVIIKGIDHNVAPEDIKQELNDLGFKAKYVYNILNRFKQPQPMFKVELTPESSRTPKGKTHPIYEVRYILNRKVTIEEPYKRKTPIQCKNCQEFGHTHTYCRLRKVCVACGGNHQTSMCTKSKENAIDKKCSNCNGNHTANYKGCPVYLAIQHNQKQQSANNMPKIIPSNPRFSLYPVPNNTTHPGAATHANGNRSEFSYANVVKNSVQQTENIQNESMLQILMSLANNINQLTQTMQQMQSMLIRQTEILSKLAK